MRENHQLGSWSHVVLLHNCLVRENWGLRMPNRKAGAEKKVSQKEELALERSGLRKVVVKILVLRWLEGRTWKWGKILEITEMHGNESWETPREAPWPVTPKTGNCEQRHGMNWWLAAQLSQPSNDLPAGKRSWVLLSAMLWASE